MIKINKNSAPIPFINYLKETPGVSYSSLRSDMKSIIKKSLIAEQGGICAYCMCRIKEDSTTIEHWNAQTEFPSLALDYNNMLAVCEGNPGRRSGMHCDKHRGSTTITVNPLDESTLKGIYYGSDGKIFSSNTEIDYDLNTTLNLNANKASLPQNRKSALEALIMKIKSEINQNTPEDKKIIFVRWLEKLNSKTEKNEYIGILTYWLNTKINELE